MSNEWQDEKRIINVSNRLPVKISVVNSKNTYQRSEGGLATGLSSVFAEYNNVWIGWPGAIVEKDEQQEVTIELAKKNLLPIFLSQDEIINFYEGFSNETIWPLFHYFPTYSKYNQQYWDSYYAVNKKFADEIIKSATNNDVVWIHDYQLMLVPAMVRAALPDITIGYFQHIPFPSYEIFRSLPWKSEILRGLLGADTIGFQTDEDTQHFIGAIKKILHINAWGKEVPIEKRIVSVHAFPIGIDYNKYKELASAPETIEYAEKIINNIGTKIAISVDRLDYSKGIIQRLQAFELFLQKNPEWHEQVTLVHLVVPSRDTVGKYKELKEEMNQLISEINGKYATLEWQPIHHFYRSFTPNMLSALYKIADLALVTPLRDGMNLVSKEYIASNLDHNGVLILSESAGAANELTHALMVNPHDISAFASKILKGLNMVPEEKKRRMIAMQRKIETANIFVWAENFMEQLMETTGKQSLNVCTPVNKAVVEKIDNQYSVADKRLLLLDYDGTMVPFFEKTGDAVPDADLMRLLANLCSDKRNNVVIISGRDNITLDKWLGNLPLDIVGEHGAWYRQAGKPWFSVAGMQAEWKTDVSQTMALFTKDTPGAFIEEKTYSLAWHYRAVDSALGEATATDVINELKLKLKGRGLDILHGNKVIEVKNSAVNKGKAAQQLISNGKYDFIMAIGDDTTDEDMFKVLPDDSISIKVGANISAATYWQSSYKDVRGLLAQMVDFAKKNRAASLHS